MLINTHQCLDINYANFKNEKIIMLFLNNLINVIAEMELMENESGVERLFFDLSSESRLGILRKLQKTNLKMQEVTKALDLTTTETFRQLQRLSESKLIQKQSDGKYNLTPYGNLALTMVSTMDFLHKNKDYFLEHEIWRLPLPFINRISEISKGVFINEMATILNSMEKIIENAQSYVWIMTDQYLDSHSRAMKNRREHGVYFKALLHDKLFDPEQADLIYKGQKVERRFLPIIDFILIITEKEAVMSIPLIGGKTANSGFVGNDPTFLKWASDLYNNYWDKARRARSYGLNPT